MQNELVNRMATHYTEQYTNDEINKIISEYDKDDDIYVVFSNRIYSKPKNGNRLNTDAFWRQLCFCNRQLFTFMLVRCYDKNGTFKWNTILNLYYTKVDVVVMEDKLYDLRIRNYSSSSTYNNQIETNLIHPVKKTIGYMRQLYVDVSEAYTNTLNNDNLPDSNNYVYFFNKDGTITYGAAKNHASGYSYANIYDTFMNFIFGNNVNLTLEGSDKVYYDLLFTYSAIYEIDPGTITKMSSFITKYTNNCGIKAPSYTEGYVVMLKAKIAEMYQGFSVTFLDLTKQNETLNWESEVLILTYVVDSTVFTITYNLDFDDNESGGKITKITALQFNGIELYTVFTVDMNSAFSVNYMNGLVVADPGSNVTNSTINLDVGITYNKYGSPMYALTYRNTWYNNVKNPESPSILCIGLIY